MKPDHVRLCIEYILDTEREDFYENPSDNHIYFHALCAFYNNRVAKEELSEAMEELNK